MLSTNWQGYRYAAWAGIAVLAVTIVVVLFQGDFLPAAALTGFLVIAFLFVKFDRRLPRLFDLLCVLAAIINAGGWAWDLYNKPGLYDEVAHFFTMFALTLAVGYLLFDRLIRSFYDHRLLFVITIAALGIAIGGLWEVTEWVADFVIPKDIISDLDDTITDLILDSLGAVLAATMNVYVLDERSRSDEAEENNERQKQKAFAKAV